MKNIGQNFYCKSIDYKSAIKNNAPFLWLFAHVVATFATPLLKTAIFNKSTGWRGKN